MSIGAKIKKIRQEHNMTQLDIAKICGVTDGAVSTWERDIADPRMGALQKLSDYLGIKVSDLIKDDDTFPVDLSDYVMIPVYGRIPAGAPKQPTVENGSICIARVDHYDATVKKFVQHDSRTIVLQPLNSEYDPIIFTGDSSEPSLEIIGKVVEVRHAL